VAAQIRPICPVAELLELDPTTAPNGGSGRGRYLRVDHARCSEEADVTPPDALIIAGIALALLGGLAWRR
jgi:hypothetical protein